jgi:hypothetical protein
MTFPFKPFSFKVVEYVHHLHLRRFSYNFNVAVSSVEDNMAEYGTVMKDIARHNVS